MNQKKLVLILIGVALFVLGFVYVAGIIQNNAKNNTAKDELTAAGVELDTIETSLLSSVESLDTFRTEQCYDVQGETTCSQVLSLTALGEPDIQLEAATNQLNTLLTNSEYFSFSGLQMQPGENGGTEDAGTFSTDEPSMNVCEFFVTALSSSATDPDSRGSFSAEITCLQTEISNAFYTRVD